MKNRVSIVKYIGLVGIAMALNAPAAQATMYTIEEHILNTNGVVSEICGTNVGNAQGSREITLAFLANPSNTATINSLGGMTYVDGQLKNAMAHHQRLFVNAIGGGIENDCVKPPQLSCSYHAWLSPTPAYDLTGSLPASCPAS